MATFDFMAAEDPVAQEDAQAFARFLAARIGPPLRACDLFDRLAEALAAFYSDVPARRAAVVRELMLAASTDAPDEIDLLRQVTGAVLRDVEAAPHASARLERALADISALPAP